MSGFSDFEPDELWALAEMCKRIDYNTINDLSKNLDEMGHMLIGIEKLLQLLADMGYAVR